jgi:Tripartite tricarboxylate transporter family receptor
MGEGRHRRRGFRRHRSGEIATPRAGRGHRDRPAEPSLLPAAALPSRDRGALRPTWLGRSATFWADGYTLLQLNVANAINTALYEKLNFNLLNDIVPVASFMRVPDVMEVTLSLPIKTVPEFIAYARANPGKISFASSGVGSSIHMSGELFKAMAKIDMLHLYGRASWSRQQQGFSRQARPSVRAAA